MVWLTNPRSAGTVASRLRLLPLFFICVASFALTSCDVITPRQQPSKRILFIGNSYTAINGGIDKQLQGLDPSVETLRIDVGGYTLQNHWTDGKALAAIRGSKWDYVVLQEQSQTSVFDPAKFNQYASQFDAAIKSAGAKTVLLMTWERPDSAKQGVTTANLETAYNNLGRTLGAKVAPAGSAFARSLRSRPDLVLYVSDGHPTMSGTYLAALVVYGVTISNPVGNPYSDSSISAENRDFLEQVAAQTLGF